MTPETGPDLPADTETHRPADDQTATRLDSGRVVVAMSGGVDSTAAALLLKRQGMDVIGATLRLHDRADAAIADAKAVCAQLGIPHRVLDRRDAFAEAVVTPFVSEYLAGRTPNPCIFCNPALKFRSMMLLADELDAQWIATGHYVRIARHPRTGRLALAQAPVGQKDQSYFLYRLGQETLTRLMLPLAERAKPDVRAIVRDAGIRTASRQASADQPDSQDICFIETDHVDFLKRYAAEHPEWQAAWLRLNRAGPVTDRSGRVIGRHPGLAGFTRGQRRGFETTGIERLYVLGSDPARNTLVVGSHADVARDRFDIQDVVWSGWVEPDPGRRLECRIRNTPTAVSGRVRPLSCGRFRVELEKPVHAPAPGQSAVFYEDGMIVFGGVIADIDGE